MMKLFTLNILCLISVTSQAELQTMTDLELSSSTGDGLGFALEDFAFSTNDATMTLTGIENSNNEEILVQWTDFYIYGEGSNYGSQKVTTNIGSYLHPWVFQTVRGGSAPEYMSIGDDVALLELKADSYSNPLQNSTDFILHSRYQGCIWGHDGCGGSVSDSPYDAVASIDSQLTQYSNERAELLNLYNNFYGSAVASNLLQEAESVQTVGGVVYEQQQVIANQQVILADAIKSYEVVNPGAYTEAKEIAGVEYQSAIELYAATEKTVELGEKYGCGWFCTPEEGAYNDQVDEWNDAVSIVGDIEQNWEDENLELALVNRELGEILIGEESKDETGRTLAERISDSDRFQILCGESANDDECSDGMIVKRGDERNVVNDIAVSLSGGQTRRLGQDIGSRFRFEVINENANTGEITRVEDFLSFELRGVHLDGSYFRLWSRENPDTGYDELNGEFSLRFFAKQYAISACGEECEINNNDSQSVIDQKVALRDNTALKLNNYLYDLSLGYGDVQPLKFDVTSDGNFVIELGFPDFDTTGLPRTVSNVQSFYNDYYENAPKSNLIIGQVQLGAVPEIGPNLGDLGGTRAVGLRAQYLRIESYDVN